MTLGAITTDHLAVAGGSDVNLDIIHFTGDSNYPTGGTAAFTDKVRAALGKGDVEILAVLAQDCGGFQVVYEPGTDKLLVLTASGGGATVSAPALSAFIPPPEPTTVAAALAAFTDPPSAGEMALLRSLVNEFRVQQEARAAVQVAWQAQLDATRALVNELRTDASSTAAIVEVSNAANLSSTTFHVLVISR